MKMKKKKKKRNERMASAINQPNEVYYNKLCHFVTMEEELFCSIQKQNIFGKSFVGINRITLN